ncbi:MAG: CAP domain-containing protein [Hyphomicrobiaceae bacterium]
MRCIFISVLLAVALSGCSVANLPIPTGFAADETDYGLDAVGGMSLAASAGGDIVSPSTLKRRAQERAARNAATETEVAVDSTASAPAGALADRDYSKAKLNPNDALTLINDYRGENGLKPLKLDPLLVAAAKTHSRDLAKHDRISHYGSNGSSPWDRVAAAGYKARLAAENVGTGQVTLAEVLKGWKASEAHNKNLLLADAEHMGIALVQDTKTEFKTFWTLVVGAPL